MEETERKNTNFSLKITNVFSYGFKVPLQER